MSQFEIIALILSLVLGLSMGHLLWSAASAVRARNELELHWLPFTWAGCIFLQHAGFWFGALALDLSLEAWSWTWYLQLLLLGILLFFAGALVLPSESRYRVGSLMDDWREHGRLALPPAAAYQLLWIPTNLRSGGALLSTPNVANVLLAICAIAAFRGKTFPVQVAAVVLFAAVLVWATSFVFFGSAI